MENLYIHQKVQKGQKPSDVYKREMMRLKKLPQKRLTQEPPLFTNTKDKPSWDSTNTFIYDYLKTPTSQNLKRQSLPIVNFTQQNLQQYETINISTPLHQQLQSQGKFPELCRMSLDTNAVVHDEWNVKPQQLDQQQWTRSVVKRNQFEYTRLRQSSKQRLQQLRASGERRQHNLTLDNANLSQEAPTLVQTEFSPTHQRVFSVVKLNQTMYDPSKRTSPIQVKINPQQSFSRPPSSVNPDETQQIDLKQVPRSTQSSQLKLVINNAANYSQKQNNYTADGVTNTFFYERKSPQPVQKPSPNKKQSITTVAGSTPSKDKSQQPYGADHQNFQRLITSGDLSQELRMLEDRIKVINQQSRRGSMQGKAALKDQNSCEYGSPHRSNQVSQSILRPQQTKIYRIIGESSSSTGLSCQMDSNGFAQKSKKKSVNFKQDSDE